MSNLAPIKAMEAPETVRAVTITSEADTVGRGSLVAVDPTQVRRPWRSTARTIFQAFLGLCVLAPVLVQAAGVEVAQLPWLVLVLGVAAAVTRVMALPGVEQWLRRFVPFLAAAPSSAGADAVRLRDDRGATDLQAIAVTTGLLLAAFAFSVLITATRS